MVGTSIVPLSGMFFIVLFAASAVFTFIVALIARFAARPRTQRLSSSQIQTAELEKTLREKSAAFAASDEIAKTEIKNLKSQLKEMAAALQKQETALSEAKTDLSASQKRAEGLSRHIAELQAEEQKNLKLLEAARQKEQSLAVQLTTLQAAKETGDDQLAKFRIKYEVASATIDTLQNDIKEIRQAAQKELEAKTLKDRAAEQKFKDELKAKSELIQKQYEERLTALQRTTPTEPDRTIENELTGKLRLAEERLEESQKNFESFKHEIALRQEELESEIRESITTELELKDEIKELEAANAEIETECRQLKAALKDETAKTLGLENQKEVLAKDLDSLKTLFEQSRQQNAAPQAVKQTAKPAASKENNGYDPLQAWIRRFSLGHLGERIWITRDEFESLEEEIKKKDALIEKSHQQNQ